MLDFPSDFHSNYPLPLMYYYVRGNFRMFSFQRTASATLIFATASTLTACGGGATNNAVPNTPALESVASSSTSTPIQIFSYNAYYYPWLNFSVGATVKPYMASTSAAQAIVISAGLPSREAYAIELQSGQPTFVENTVNGSVILKAPNTRLIAGNTYSLLGTYDGSTARLYVNGTLTASAPITGGVWNDRTTGEAIGADANRNNPFNGLISNVTILPSTITPTPNPNPAPTPTAKPTVAPAPPPITNAPVFAPASVSLLSIGSTATVRLSEAKYSGSYSIRSTCSTIATIAQNGASITLTATGVGSCSVTATDANRQAVVLPVTVTSTVMQFE
jgi:hypothetical protein